MINEWNTAIENFIVLATKYSVKMIMVGGAAVNFHGYQRHSADGEKPESSLNLAFGYH